MPIAYKGGTLGLDLDRDSEADPLLRAFSKNRETSGHDARGLWVLNEAYSI